MPSGEIAGQAIEQVIADAPTHRGLRPRRACAHDEIVLTETLDEAACIRWRMLAVRVEDQDELTFRSANAGLHCGTIALGIRVPHDQRARSCRPLTCRVTRAIVHDEDLSPRGLGTQARDDVADRVLFVQRRDHDRYARGVSQAGAPRHHPT